ncbi:MAG: hypothetical protein WDW36_008270 [Sanguina aurantia]
MVLGLGFSAASAASVAQTTNAATEQRLNALEARIAALERMQAQAPAASAPPAAAAGAAPYAASRPEMAAAPAPVAAPRVVRAQPTAADFNELHRGMTVSQVIKLLGKPGDSRVLPTSSTYYYPDTHGRSVEFDRDSRVIQWSQP